jgi:hypothetical protein
LRMLQQLAAVAITQPRSSSTRSNIACRRGPGRGDALRHVHCVATLLQVGLQASGCQAITTKKSRTRALSASLRVPTCDA